jgi:hypothetical protein
VLALALALAQVAADAAAAGEFEIDYEKLQRASAPILKDEQPFNAIPDGVACDVHQL